MTISLNGTTGITTPGETVNGNETITGNLSVTGNVTVTGLINANGGGLIKSGTAISTATTSFTGSCPATNILTASAPIVGTIQVGQVIAGTGVTAGTSIISQLTGTPGGAGTYQLSSSQLAAVSGTITVVGVDFYGIPSTAKRITVMFNGVSTSGSSNYLIQLGAGSIVNSGYVTTGAYFGPSQAGTTATAGICLVYATGATVSFSGSSVITLLSPTNWVASSSFGRNDGYMMLSSGAITNLGGTLDRVRITTVGSPPTDTFDAGSINILYE